MQYLYVRSLFDESEDALPHIAKYSELDQRAHSLRAKSSKNAIN